MVIVIIIIMIIIIAKGDMRRRVKLWHFETTTECDFSIKLRVFFKRLKDDFDGVFVLYFW